jgi:hypothetical protein
MPLLRLRRRPRALSKTIIIIWRTRRRIEAGTCCGGRDAAGSTRGLPEQRSQTCYGGPSWQCAQESCMFVVLRTYLNTTTRPCRTALPIHTCLSVCLSLTRRHCLRSCCCCRGMAFVAVDPPQQAWSCEGARQQPVADRVGVGLLPSAIEPQAHCAVPAHPNRQGGARRQLAVHHKCGRSCCCCCCCRAASAVVVAWRTRDCACHRPVR